MICVTCQYDTYPDIPKGKMAMEMLESDVSKAANTKKGDQLIIAHSYRIIQSSLLGEKFHRPRIEHNIDKEKFSFSDIGNCVIQKL